MALPRQRMLVEGPMSAAVHCHRYFGIARSGVVLSGASFDYKYLSIQVLSTSSQLPCLTSTFTLTSFNMLKKAEVNVRSLHAQCSLIHSATYPKTDGLCRVILPPSHSVTSVLFHRVQSVPKSLVHALVSTTARKWLNGSVAAVPVRQPAATAIAA